MEGRRLLLLRGEEEKPNWWLAKLQQDISEDTTGAVQYCTVLILDVCYLSHEVAQCFLLPRPAFAIQFIPLKKLIHIWRIRWNTCANLWKRDVKFVIHVTWEERFVLHVTKKKTGKLVSHLLMCRFEVIYAKRTNVFTSIQCGFRPTLCFCQILFLQIVGSIQTRHQNKHS